MVRSRSARSTAVVVSVALVASCLTILIAFAPPAAAVDDANYPSRVLADNPISYWRLNEISGSAAADEKSVNPGVYTGSVTKGVPGAVTSDPAIHVGAGGHVHITSGSTVAPAGNYTLEAWVRAAAPAGWQTILRWHAFGWHLYIDENGKPTTNVYTSNATASVRTVTGPSSITDNEWHYLVASKGDGGRLRLYVDGSEVASTPIDPTTYYCCDYTVGIGADATDPNWAPFYGDIDEVAVYDHALTTAQIASHFGPHTRTTIATTGSPSYVSDSVTFTASVSRGNGSNTPTGTITFSDNGLPVSTVAVDANAQATWTTTTLPFGTHNITASYSGDNDYYPSKSAPLAQIVQLHPNDVGLRTAPNPSSVGGAVAATAAVGSRNGSAVPTGTITLRDAGATLASQSLDGTGATTFNTSSLARGMHPLTASYSGDSVYLANQSSVVYQAVNAAGAASTTTALNASPTSQNATAPVNFTATVTKASGTPSGSVDFLEGSTVLGSANLDGNGVAAFTTSTLPTGSHTIVAAYNGDNTSAASLSPAATVVVVTVATTTALSSSLNPSAATQPVTFTATVSATGAGAVPSGTVTFKDGTTTLGTATLSNGTTTFTTSTLAAGSRSITAIYGGDQYFQTSTSSPLTQVVSGFATTTALQASSNPAAK
jgi:hypothetical protein